MKVKKKYLLIIGITIIVAFLIVFSISLFLLSKYNLTIKDGQRIITSGFFLKPADKNDIQGHISESQKYIDILHYELNLELLLR